MRSKLFPPLPNSKQQNQGFRWFWILFLTSFVGFHSDCKSFFCPRSFIYKGNSEHPQFHPHYSSSVQWSQRGVWLELKQRKKPRKHFCLMVTTQQIITFLHTEGWREESFLRQQLDAIYTRHKFWFTHACSASWSVGYLWELHEHMLKAADWLVIFSLLSSWFSFFILNSASSVCIPELCYFTLNSYSYPVHVGSKAIPPVSPLSPD